MNTTGFFHIKDKQKAMNYAFLIGLFALVAFNMVYAKGTEQAGFKDVWATITAYMQGSLGRILVGLMVVVGVAAAVVRQSLMVFAVAVGGAIGLYYAPDIIDGMMTSSDIPSVLPDLPAADKAMMLIQSVKVW